MPQTSNSSPPPPLTASRISRRRTDTLPRAFRVWRGSPTKGSPQTLPNQPPAHRISILVSVHTSSASHLRRRDRQRAPPRPALHRHILWSASKPSKAPTSRVQVSPVQLLAHGLCRTNWKRALAKLVWSRTRVRSPSPVFCLAQAGRSIRGYFPASCLGRIIRLPAVALNRRPWPCSCTSALRRAVIFAGWADCEEYRSQASTPAWRPLWDYMDFFREIGYSFRFFFTRKPHPERPPPCNIALRTNVSALRAQAFGIAEYQQHPHHQPRNDVVAGTAYPLTARNSDPEERQRLRPAVSPNLEPTFPQQHLQPGVESQRPLSEGEDLDLGYYSSAYEGIEEAAYPQPRQEVVYPQQGPQPAYPPQPPQQLQPGYNAAAGARDSFQAWTGPRAL
ncbi:hypothetical protein D9611_013441 [Ephemerocybe angulata]|uniref:Uncharacterized protein n=1 Tax=Ephemerocybe angulata TaxID=980116 RepID=A0A8H5FAN6_9AGAR|nr:hypothetical protein D9611_013441 [Tulosesus angulatus]